MNDATTLEEPTESVLRRVSAALAEVAGLKLVLLVGSRARADAHAASDWDFAFLGTPEVDPDEILRRLSLAIGTDDVDLVDLAGASVLFRHRAATEGRRILGEKDAHDDFVIDATLTYLDMEPTLRAAYASVLDEAAR